MKTTRRRPARKVAGRPRPDERGHALAVANDLASEIERLHAETAVITKRRNAWVVAARDAGCTWREVAASVGLTEMGVRKIYERTDATEVDLGGK